MTKNISSSFNFNSTFNLVFFAAYGGSDLSGGDAMDIGNVNDTTVDDGDDYISSYYWDFIQNSLNGILRYYRPNVYGRWQLF